MNENSVYRAYCLKFQDAMITRSYPITSGVPKVIAFLRTKEGTVTTIYT